MSAVPEEDPEGFGDAPVPEKRPNHLDVASSIRDQIAAFKAKLNDFTRNNPLIFFRDLKVGTLALPEIGTPVIKKLLDGTAITLADLQAAGDIKTRAKLRGIHLKAQANAEERGLQTLFVAIGFATWTLSENPSPSTRLRSVKKNEDVGEPKRLSPPRNPLAPLLLLPVEIQKANSPGSDPKIARAGDIQVNQALLAFVQETYNIRIDVDELAEDITEDPEPLLARLRELLAELPGVTFPSRCVIGNFNFQKMAMISDLSDHLALIAKNDLIAAISGDAEAQAQLSLDQGGETSSCLLDAIPARDELFVLDADSSQQQVLHSVLRSKTHAVIQGPPGTGKSQTIANLIAALIGDGKRVLFVAEKRAALDAVRKRLTKVGLGHLVLDLHGADVKRKSIYHGLQEADAIARSVPAPDFETMYQEFEDARRKLNAHDKSMHENRPACGGSLYELIVRFAKIPELAKCDLRLSSVQLEHLSAPDMQKIRLLFSEAAAVSPLFVRDPSTPWAHAELVDKGGADAAVSLVAALHEDLSDALPEANLLAQKMGVTGAQSLIDLEDLSKRLTAASSAAILFKAEICLLDLERVAATFSRHNANIFARFLSLFNVEARATAKTLRSAAQQQATADELLRGLQTLLALPVEWRSPKVFAALERLDPRKLVSACTRIATNSRAFAQVANEPQPFDSLAELLSLVTTYQQTQANAYKAVRAHGLRGQIAAAGVSNVLKEIDRTSRAPDLWADLFEGIWLRSYIERVSIDDPEISGFNRAQFEAVIAKFKELDVDRLNLAAIRVCRSAAEAYFEAQKQYPQQAIVFRTNLARKTKQLPLRKLMKQAGQVTSALTPCWMASPLSVSQLTDPRSQFDVVIFDEASQVLPEDAITSIIRGKRVVIAGDKHQLPPTTFFAGTSENDDDEDGGTSDDNAEDIESILDLMSIYVRPQSLDWHYRSLDERLIAFSNKEFYGNSLITFPSREEPPPAMRHILVDELKRDGDENSNSAEVLRVVELILEHAESRPHESLGVIAMGIKHATRIEKTLYEARQKRPDLDDFFSDQGERTFFCKNLERVQGDERDAVILSVGYGKNARGDMVYRFGPLNNAGGERRLNVAVSRAVRRMTLVSSFRSTDMDDTKLNATGAKLLKRYIRFAESDGRDLGNDGANDKIPMNEFEADIYYALSEHGLTMIPQYGTSSYRLDFAVQDPRAPGSYCLAIECDGATYHSAQSARDRDRIRQTHLEAQGWTFHHIWSTDWFQDRFGEIGRALAAYETAIKAPQEVPPFTPSKITADAAPTESIPRPHRSGARPRITAGAPIDTYSASELLEIVRWIVSDGLLRSGEKIIEEASDAMGYERIGARIRRTLQAAIASAGLS